MSWDTDHRAGRFEPGQLLFGRYVALRRLGRGGMGSVWLVRHRELDTERALKIIAPEIALTAEALGRFRREARVMAKLSHPQVVTVHDAQIHRDGSFIELEPVQGRSIDALLRPGVPARLEWVVQLLVQLCDVLQAAHEQRIVLASDEVGAVVFCSSTPRELSQEDARWGHGAFTKAILDAMDDPSSDLNRDGYLSITEFDYQISERVKTLTEGRQHPVTQKPPSLGDLPFYKVVPSGAQR